MSAPRSGTLRLSRRLREKGRFAPGQAETLAGAIGQEGHDDLATKTNVADLKAGILKRVAGAIGFQTAVILRTIVGLARIFVK